MVYQNLQSNGIQSLSKMTGPGALFETLVVGIITGRFKAGQRLIERDLVAEFGLSRTPVREAIRKIENLGLVQCSPNKGAVVTDFTPHDIEHLYLLRINLERLAGRFAFSNLRQNEIDSLKEINRQLQLCLKSSNLLQLIEKDKQFHHIIYEASGNRFLVEVLEQLRLKCYVVAYYAWADPNRVKLSIDGHREIIKSLKEKNREKFQNLLEQQLVSAKAYYLENLR